MWLKDDFKRYHYLVTLHAVSTVTFLIRFIVICTDLSSANSYAIGYIVAILLLELISCLIVLIANILYVFLRYIGPILFESDRDKVGCCSQTFAWSLATVTCLRCNCHLEHPQAVLLTRFFILLAFQLMRFIAFILACVCANKYGPTALAYSILAAFSLVPSVLMLIIEYCHHHRLWFHYRPDTSSEEKLTYSSGHRGFIPLTLMNDQQTSHWQNGRCPNGETCPSRNLHHVLMYHSANTRYAPQQRKDNQVVVGFHQTDHAAAASIARTGFKPSRDGMLGPGVYFATSLDHTEFKANQYGTYICAKVALGKTSRVKKGDAKPSNEFDTAYLEHERGADEFCVRKPEQILSWIIVVDQDPNARALKRGDAGRLPSGKFIEDRMEVIVYKGCFF